MLASELNFGIPDLDLQWSCGGTVNPSCFVGHQLLVLFLPASARKRAAELVSYEKLANEFTDTDAWFLVIGDAWTAGEPRRIPIALDENEAAWRAFAKVAKTRAKLDRAEGAAFVFTRGGAFHRVWPGHGHAAEVFEELMTRG